VRVPEGATLPAGLTASGGQAGEAIFQHGAVSQGGRLLQSFPACRQAGSFAMTLRFRFHFFKPICR